MGFQRQPEVRIPALGCIVLLDILLLFANERPGFVQFEAGDL